MQDTPVQFLGQEDPLEKGVGYTLQYSCAFIVAQLVKNLPAMRETRVLSLGWKDLLEKGQTPHSSILAWIIPWTEEPGRLQSIGLHRVGHDQSDLQQRPRESFLNVS